MHNIADWVSLHLTDTETLQDIVQALRSNSVSQSPLNWPEAPVAPASRSLGSLDICFDQFVLPAICQRLDPDCDSKVQGKLNKIQFKSLANANTKFPSTWFDPDTGQAVIAMDWSGHPADLICLAHEVGHAAHIALTDGKSLPPISRETCAFLAELIVLDHLADVDADLCDALQFEWVHENHRYLGEDTDGLTAALSNPESEYHYRLNYPIARLAAVHVFNHDKGRKSSELDSVSAIFSDLNPMKSIPLAELAAGADRIENYLPAFPRSEDGALSAYRALGAMTLLDVDTFQGASEQDIGTHYENLIQHLQQQSAFIALRQDQRPIGYATWNRLDGRSAVRLTHQTAPFGDHLTLQRELRKRFGAGVPATAIADRSARQEQVAW